MTKNVTLLSGNNWQALYINNIKVVEGAKLTSESIFSALENEVDYDINFVKIDLSENDFTYILSLIYDNGLSTEQIIPTISFDKALNSSINLPAELSADNTTENEATVNETNNVPKVGSEIYIAGTIGALCTVTPGKAIIETVQVVGGNIATIDFDSENDFDDDEDGDYTTNDEPAENDYTNVSIYLTFKNIPDYIEKWDILEPIQDRLATQLGDVTAMYII